MRKKHRLHIICDIGSMIFFMSELVLRELISPIPVSLTSAGNEDDEDVLASRTL